MAQVVKLKRTAVEGKVPSTAHLELGELAINTYDGRIFFEKDNGTPSVEHVVTTNSETTGSINVFGNVTASYFYGDGSNLTNLPNADVSQVATVTSSFDDTNTISVLHNFDTKNVIISVYQSNDTQLIPQSVTLTNNNTVDITLSGNHSGYVVVAKGGHIVSGSASDSTQLNGHAGSYYLDFNNHTNNPFTQSDSAITASGHIVPSENITYDLGSPTNRFRDLYLSNNSIFFEYTSLSVNTGSGVFEIKDANNDPANIRVESFIISPSGSSNQTFISQGTQGGVKFLSFSDTQMVTYSIDNYDLQSSVTFSYIDSAGNPQTVSVPANTNNYELDAQEGSVSRTSGTDKYRIKLLRVPDGTPTAQIEVSSLIISSSDGFTTINSGESGSIVLPRLIISGSDGSTTINSGESGSIVLPRLIISGSNGQSTLSNDYSGGLAVLNNDETLGKIRVTELELVDSTTGNIINLVTVSGSLTTTANDSSGNSIEPPKSNLSGSFTGSFNLTGDVVATADCVKVGTISNPICEIHGTDIFGSIRANNGIISGSSQITDLTTYKEDVSGNSTYTITHNLNEEYPIVQAWNTSTKRQEVPSIVQSTSVNVLDITFSSTFSGRIIVKK